MSASSSEKQFDLILIGKTGNGKSSTGNTILGRQVFTVGDAGTSVTISTELGYSKLDSSVIVKVIDTPGIVDTRMDEAEQVKEAVNNLCQGFRNCPNGFHALVLILKYGSRYTQEEKYTIHFLKHLFGGSFIRDHCILIFSNGENFDLQARKTRGLTFEKWCEDQREDLGELIQECGNRVVLFYNMAPEKREEAVQRLLSLVQSIGKRYTSVLFEHIKEERDRILAGGGFTENMEKRLGVIISLIDRLKRATYEGDCYREALCDIKLEIAGLEAETDQEEQGKADLLAVWMIIAKIKLNIDRYVNQGQESAFGESFTLMDNSQMSDFYTGNRGLTIETVDPTVDTFQLAANTAQLTANTVQLAADIVQPTANTVQLTETYLTKEIGKTGDELQLALKKRANIIRHFANNFVTIFQRFLRLLGRAF